MYFPGAGAFKAVLIAALLLASCVFVASTAQASPLRVADSSSASVLFNVDLLPLSSLTVALQLTASASLSGGSISPGQSVNASASVSVPTTVSLSITYLGATSSVVVPGVGTSYDIPVPGLGLSYLGVSLGVFLNFSGVISAINTISGPGTGGGGALQWVSSSTAYFGITASPNATGGSSITSTLSNITYGVSMGLDAGAQIPIIGSYLVNLLTFGSIGLVPGAPTSIQSAYTVPEPSPIGALGADSAAALGLVFIVIVVAAIAVVIILARRHRTKPPATPYTLPPSLTVPPPPPPPPPWGGT